MGQSRAGDIVWVTVATLAIFVIGAIVLRERSPTVRTPVESRTIPAGISVTEGGHLLGSASAPVKLVEFSNFQCSFCARLQVTLRELRARHPETVAVIYRHYPPAGHLTGLAAAIASECAADQGRFEQYANHPFENQDSLSFVTWRTLALRSGVPDTARFQRCLDDERMRARADADIAVGASIGVPGTPALILGDRMFVGALALDSLEALIRTRRPARAP